MIKRENSWIGAEWGEFGKNTRECVANAQSTGASIDLAISLLFCREVGLQYDIVVEKQIVAVCSRCCSDFQENEGGVGREMEAQLHVLGCLLWHQESDFDDS